MLKMQKEKKNSGMSLVEVIISMLVLSIAVVTVLSAFSMASKTNLQSKKHQCVESLMENFIEYAEAGGTEFAGYFGVTAGDYTVTEAGAIKTETLKNLRQGYFDFDVEVTTDTAPDEYVNTLTDTGELLNNRKVIHFGGSGSKTVLIDASKKTNESKGYDASAHSYFYTWHTMEIDSRLAKVEEKRADGTYTDDVADAEKITIEGLRKSLSEMGNYIDRELWITAVATGTNKMKLQASFRYELNSSVVLPAGVVTVYSSLIYVSDEFDFADATTDGENKLDQVYVLYSDPEAEDNAKGKDIRILDGETDAEKKLDVIFYIVDQEETLADWSSLNFVEELGSRAVDKTYNISFKNPDVDKVQTPQKAEVYCSVNALLEDGGTVVSLMGTKNIIEKGNEIRVVTVTIKVLDQNTGNVLSTKEITRLQ